MTPTTTSTCPKCKKPLDQNSKFCANCGNDVSGVWSKSNPGALGGTIAVEMDPNVDTLGQMLSEATLGDYEIYGELGRGGMAAVYLGHDIALDRKVAIKTMLPELVSKEGMVARFKREAQTAASLSHPHVIQIFSVKESKQLCFFVMKFIEGRSLESVINDKGKVPLQMAQTIMGQVGSALDYAHRKKVIHRDIKPANIMIDEDGWAIVTDFGIAKVQEAQNLTATGTAIGTPHYMSPEQFHNKAVTGQSDQYSLGVVLYEMLAGKKPFDGGTYAEIITQHLFEQVPDIREFNAEVPGHVVDVIKKMMAKDPAERFESLDAAVHALGTPTSKKEGDVVRTQMISLAKSGPQKKLRMSVPMSPIPVQKKKPAPAATAIEPAVVPAKSGGGAGKWAAVIVLLAVLGGGGYFGYTKMQTPAAGKTVAVVPQGETTPPAATDSAAPEAQPPATKAAAAGPNVDSIIAATAEKMAREQARKDSIARAQARRDSINREKAAAKEAASKPKPTAVAERSREQEQKAAAPAPVVQEPAAPAAPATTQIRIGSRTPGATLYINGVVDNLLSSPRFVTIPAGVPVKIEVRAACGAPFDTTITVPAGPAVTIGYRNAKC
jgi:serine/threonine protein kinase